MEKIKYSNFFAKAEGKIRFLLLLYVYYILKPVLKGIITRN